MNNIEEKIKKEFQQREIQPSITAWEKLDEKLEQSETKNKNKFIIFIRIAAVFIGLLFAVSFFFKDKTTTLNETKNPIVSTDNKQNIQTINNVNEAAIQTSVKKDEVITNNTTKKIKNEAIVNNKESIFLLENTKPQQTVKRSKPLNLRHKKYTNSKVVLNEEQNNLAQIKKSITTEPSQKVSLAQVQQNKSTKQLMNSSDEDVENMLAKALNNKNQRSFKIKIEDKKLQYAAEKTLNTSLKYKVYQTIKSGVNSVIVYNKNKNQ